MSKQNILSSSEIKKTFNNVEEKCSALHFTLLLSSRDVEEAGLCVILAKRNIKKATKRNLCRRLIKEFFRLNKNKFAGKSLVILAKKPAEKATKEDLWGSINKFYQILEVL